ncbi:MAG TPA: PPC domain-containing protein, partial [Gemmataceae bacterium]|nr:PPC domain-containing protein [Gemmataceae bacterium]
MIRTHLLGSLALSSLLLASATSIAQPQVPPMPNPRLLVVMPPGGKAGSTVELALTGQDLDAPQGLLFGLPSIEAELVTDAPPSDAKKAEQKKPAPNQPAVTTLKFKVTIPADAPPGIHDVRLVTALGVSNPRAFVVGDLPESLEKEPNNDVPEAQRIELNSTVNGTISAPTDVDYFVFAGKAGQRVVASCLASSIDSRLAAGLELYAKQGSLLAANHEFLGTDAVLDYTLPLDGDYLVRVFAFTYTQGSPEHFYRLTVSTAPWIDAVYPPVVEPGKKTPVTVYGRNLPGGKPDPLAILEGRRLEKITMTVEPPTEAAARTRLRYSGFVPPRSSFLDGFELRLRNEAGVSNPYLITYARAPVVLDNEANDSAEAAQEIPIPCEIVGRVEKKGDRDCYRFQAKKGEVFGIEAFADRIGAPVSLSCTIRPMKDKGPGTEFADNNDSLHPTLFFSRSEDPARQRFVAPADGEYLLK